MPQRRQLQLRNQRLRRPFSELARLSSIAVDNDPASPSYGDLYVPDLLNGSRRQVQPRRQVHWPRSTVSLPTGVAVDPPTATSTSVNFSGTVTCSTPWRTRTIYQLQAGEPGTQTSDFDDRATSTGVAVDSHGNVYVDQRRRAIRKPKAPREIYSSSGTDPRELARRQPAPTASPSIPQRRLTSTSTKATRSSSSTPPGNPVGAPIGTGAASRRLDRPRRRTPAEPRSSPNRRPHGNVAVLRATRLTHPTRTPTTRSSSTASARPEARHTADFQVTPSGE